ncbi:MAG: response regulator [Lentisphaerae bacterium]|nr:response regulator [Lentisphaerota bacterium]
MAHILLLDDEPDLLSLLSKTMIAAGHETVTVDRGDAAIDRLRESSFDLLVSDVRMQPVNGIEVLAAARKMKPDMPVIMLTAYADDATIQKAKKLGAYAYLIKPFNIGELLDTVKRALVDAKAGGKFNG